MEKLDFGNLLIEARKAKGLTQAEVAEKSNITTRTIQRIESGAVKPRISTIKILSEHIGVDFSEILNQNPKSEKHTIIWYLKDLFNLKTNKIKKLSILSTTILCVIFIGVKISNIKAQSNTIEKNQQEKSETHDEEAFNPNDFDFDEFEVLDENFIWTLKNNMHGLMTIDGKLIIPNEYDEFEIQENFIWTLKNNKHGLMNLEGKVIIPNEYDEFEIQGDFIWTLKNNKPGLMSLDGKVIIPN